MNRVLIGLLFSLLIIFSSNSAFADSKEDLHRHIQDWNEKKELASFLLQKSQNELEAGDELSACATQKEASQYGIQATQSLMQAMQISDSKESLENLEAGLNKWRELADFC